MRITRRPLECLLALLGLLLCGAQAAAAPPARALPAYQVALDQTSVSGLSSGAYMAGQFAVAYSSIVGGVALIAGGPYYCAGAPGRAPFIPYLQNALSVCMNPAQAGTEPPDALLLWNRTQDFARAGLIDDPANLRRQSVYLFSGTADHTVSTAVVDQARNFYEFAGSARLRYVDDVAAGHGMITDAKADHACDLTAAPYFNNCARPLAQEILQALYPNLKPASTRLSGRTIRFDQRAYAPPRASMAASGYVYVPASCARVACRVHVAFHGCYQSASVIGDHFHGRAGYNLLADANDIIVLYPQVEASWFYPYNPRGCWDFWGYSSLDPMQPDFYTRDGVQQKAVRAMLARLAQPRGARR
jgi:poly(3-hydroxybutyrate) depolymerase